MSDSRNQNTSRGHVRAGEVAVVVGGASLLVGSWAAVANAHRVPARETTVFETLNSLPDSLWPIVWAPMQLGSFGGSLAVVVASATTSRQRRLALAILGASQSAYWGAKGVKRFVARDRPAALLPDVRARERTTGLGYLSGHTAVAFALASALAPSLPPASRPAAVSLAVAVAFARVYAGAHLPLDVVGGVGLGILTGTLARWAFGLGGEGVPALMAARVTT